VPIPLDIFKLDFKAAGIIGIPIRPRYLDRHFIRQYRGRVPAGWFGPGGRMCLLPSIIWVAMKPSVTLRLSEGEFQHMQSHWQSGASIGVVAGSFVFRNQQFKQVALSEESDRLKYLFSDEAIQMMIDTNDLEDTATFTVREETPLADEEESLSDADAESDTEADADFVLRGMPGPILVGPNSPVILMRQNTKVFEASFSSNSGVLQIIAITSDIL
jgi:hypothetical protein